MYPVTANGTPMTSGSSHRATGGGTGTCPYSALTTRYSRAISCAEGVSTPSGGRLSTQREIPSVTR